MAHQSKFFFESQFFVFNPKKKMEKKTHTHIKNTKQTKKTKKTKEKKKKTKQNKIKK